MPTNQELSSFLSKGHISLGESLGPVLIFGITNHFTLEPFTTAENEAEMQIFVTMPDESIVTISIEYDSLICDVLSSCLVPCVIKERDLCCRC